MLLKNISTVTRDVGVEMYYINAAAKKLLLKRKETNYGKQKNEIEEVYLAADTGKLEETAQIAETTA